MKKTRAILAGAVLAVVSPMLAVATYTLTEHGGLRGGDEPPEVNTPEPSRSSRGAGNGGSPGGFPGEHGGGLLALAAPEIEPLGLTVRQADRPALTAGYRTASAHGASGWHPMAPPTSHGALLGRDELGSPFGFPGGGPSVGGASPAPAEPSQEDGPTTGEPREPGESRNEGLAGGGEGGPAEETGSGGKPRTVPASSSQPPQLPSGPAKKPVEDGDTSPGKPDDVAQPSSDGSPGETGEPRGQDEPGADGTDPPGAPPLDDLVAALDPLPGVAYPDSGPSLTPDPYDPQPPAPTSTLRQVPEPGSLLLLALGLVGLRLLRLRGV